jgi:hypothetical protein
MVGVDILRQPVADAAGIDQCRCMEPVAAVWRAFAKSARRDAVLMVIFDRAFQVQLVVEEGMTGRRAQQKLPVVAIGTDATLGLGLETLESLVGDEVDDAADCIRPV